MEGKLELRGEENKTERFPQENKNTHFQSPQVRIPGGPRRDGLDGLEDGLEIREKSGPSCPHPARGPRAFCPAGSPLSAKGARTLGILAPLPALPVPGLRDRLGARGWGPCPGRESRSGYCGHRAGRRVPVACLLDLLPQPLPPPAPAQTFPANLGGWARAPPPRPAVQPSSPRVPAPYSRPRKTLLPGPPSPPPGAPPHLPAPPHRPRSVRLSHPHLSRSAPQVPTFPLPTPPPSWAPPPSPRPPPSPPLFSAPTTFVLLPSALSPYVPIPPPLPAAPASHFLARGSCPRPPTP
ncbi:WAS/WASL-interacting protein family member 3-like [Budorcas taxicolor]|uniref:WAS/WASL-interacting protein family member 3-like n=1 Tax=Budorcas taxicolor TaxID=37181 RepID=UPI002283F9FD|nr:WAS/WASL-interacting protein family member 3-like [Budorcas taxicolor]